MKELIRKILREETEEYNTLCLPYVGADTDPITGDVGDSRDGGNRTHGGIDLTVDSGTELIAPADGTIEKADFIESGGKCGGKVKINHSGTFISPYTGEEVKLKTVYCHLSEVSVTEGATVKKGDKIGKTGGAASKIDGSRKQKNANGEIVDADNAARISSEYYREAGAGNSTGAHLHYEVYEDGSYVSPKIYVRGGGDFDYKPCEAITTDPVEDDDPLALLIWLNQGGDVGTEEEVKTKEEILASLPACHKKSYKDSKEDSLAIAKLWQWGYINLPKDKVNALYTPTPENIEALLTYQQKYQLQQLPVDIINGCRIPQETLDHINNNENEIIVNER
jgi:hypothetical protein|tara:strand:- start:66 stop:1076 length:1011 start_codon:yes stop_codon:yes gene_type:complete